MKESFYLYFDIFGVISSNDWRNKCNEYYLERRGYSENYSRDNIMALNSFVSFLNEKYDVKLVIFGAGVLGGETLKKKLVENGLEYDKEISFTNHNIRKPAEYYVLDNIFKNHIKSNFCVLTANPTFRKDWFRKANKILSCDQEHGLTISLVGNFIRENWATSIVKLEKEFNDKIDQLETSRKLFDLSDKIKIERLDDIGVKEQAARLNGESEANLLKKAVKTTVEQPSQEDIQRVEIEKAKMALLQGVRGVKTNAEQIALRELQRGI